MPVILTGHRHSADGVVLHSGNRHRQAEEARRRARHQEVERVRLQAQLEDILLISRVAKLPAEIAQAIFADCGQHVANTDTETIWLSIADVYEGRLGYQWNWWYSDTLKAWVEGRGGEDWCEGAARAWRIDD